MHPGGKMHCEDVFLFSHHSLLLVTTVGFFVGSAEKDFGTCWTSSDIFCYACSSACLSRSCNTNSAQSMNAVIRCSHLQTNIKTELQTQVKANITEQNSAFFFLFGTTSHLFGWGDSALDFLFKCIPLCFCLKWHINEAQSKPATKEKPLWISAMTHDTPMTESTWEGTSESNRHI